MWRTVVGSSATIQTHYVFDEAGHLLAEHDGATGAVLREYVWLDDMPLAMIDSTGSAPVTYYIHTGQIEEPLVMTDAAQNKVWDAYVEPFGTAQVFGAPSAGLDLRLPGQFTEAETGGLSQNWNRDYDPSLGRYIEADPLGIEAGQNVYGYVEGDPGNLSDENGLVATITRQGNSISISVDVSLLGPLATAELARRWQRRIDDIWNPQLWVVGKCTVRIRAHIRSGGRSANMIQVRAHGRDVTYGRNMGDWFLDNGTGTWFLDSGDWPPAHELGHLMRLGDRYHDIAGVSHPELGWAGNIMGDYNGQVELRNVREVLQRNGGVPKCGCGS